MPLHKTIYSIAVFRLLRKGAKWEFSNGRGGARILKVERKGVDSSGETRHRYGVIALTEALDVFTRTEDDPRVRNLRQVLAKPQMKSTSRLFLSLYWLIVYPPSASASAESS